ncbi:MULTISPECIES: CBO0543 family protein [Paenibacillus]|uniref:CBO0543 family protein n=1 Tax=Paenibacillus TaxID=44249 RepID=UPI00191544D3|nr:CBO0543 family protein [Paenibacillus sp. EPM92]
MMIEYIVLMCVWIISISMLIFCVPKRKARIAYAGFLFKQTITWIAGLYVVEKGWIVYPVRLFPEQNRSSFTFEYLAFPAVCAVFNVHYPSGRSLPVRIGYYLAYTSVMTLVEAWIEHRLALIDYVHWAWYWTWLTLLLTFYLSRMFCLWFFQAKRLPA